MSTITEGFQPCIIDDYTSTNQDTPTKQVSGDPDIDSFVDLGSNAESDVKSGLVIRSEVREVTQEVTKQVYIGFWGWVGYTTEVVEKEVIGEESVVLYPEFERDKEAIQQELALFFDEPEKITYEDVKEYISALNEAYPDYAIDEGRGLLSEIQRTKSAMIERGERGFVRGVGLYACYSESGISTMLKVAEYQQNRSKASQDIDYQREMLNWFKYFHDCKG